MKNFITKILLSLLMLSCTDSSESEKDPSKLLNEIERIEEVGLNKYGVEFNYFKGQSFVSADFSEETKLRENSWMNNPLVLDSVMDYLEKSNKLLKEFSHLKAENERVEEIFYKNEYLKSRLNDFKDQLKLVDNSLLIELERRGTRRADKFVGICDKGIKHASEDLDQYVYDKFPHGLENYDEQNPNQFKAFLTLINNCEDFYSEFQAKEVDCVYLDSNKNVKIYSTSSTIDSCEMVEIIREEKIMNR